MTKKPLGLYLHIPFCRSKCAYCDFYSLPGNPELMDRYLLALLQEVAQWGQRAEGYMVDTLYIGGGTPSWFGAERLSALLEGIRSHFSLLPDCEITTEANPDSVTPQALAQLRSMGVNRLSLGVQSTAEAELKIAGRPHSFPQAVQAVAWAREAGFRNISLDLIYGLPGQSMESWQNSVAQLLELAPEHLSCYGLKVEPGTPFWKNRHSLPFPDEDAQADAYLWLCQRLEQAGFVQYEISNFCRPGYASRHNLKYWHMEEYLGLGPGAHSDFQGARFGYARDLQGYLQGTCPLSEHTVLSPQDRLEEYLLLGLRLAEGITAQGFHHHGGKGWSRLLPRLQQLQAHGLLQEQAGHWHCTPHGFLVSNGIIVQLLEALEG